MQSLKSFINEEAFLHASEYLSRHFFSKPYVPTINTKRWFDKIGVMELNGNKEPVFLTKEHLDFYIVDCSIECRSRMRKTRNVKRKYDGNYYFVLHNSPNELQYYDYNTQEIKTLKHKTDEMFNWAQWFYAEGYGLGTYYLHRKLRDFIKETTGNIPKGKIIPSNYLNCMSSNREGFIKNQGEYSIKEEFKHQITNMVYRPNHDLAHAVRAALILFLINWIWLDA